MTLSIYQKGSVWPSWTQLHRQDFPGKADETVVTYLSCLYLWPMPLKEQSQLQVVYTLHRHDK